MNRLLPTFFVSFLCLTSPFALAEPTNLNDAKETITTYVDSGDYQKELTEKATNATHYLQEVIKENQRLQHPKKLAVVFDIDETVLSNYPSIKKFNYCASVPTIEREISKANGKAIPPMKALYQFAKDNKVSIFFITGRPTSLKKATLKNLKKQGFKGYKKIYFKTKPFAHDKSVALYKTKMRKDIEKQGYVIVLNLGDQQSDLTGGEAMKAYKLPNPFYYIP